MDKVRGKTRKRHPLKDAMNESKLFPNTHFACPGSKYAKAVELPDPGLEPIEPQDSDEEPPPSETAKAIMMLDGMIKATPGQPDLTGELEGKFKISVGEMIEQLNKIITAEYSEWMRWYHYALVLRGHSRDGMAEEFEGHAEEELGHLSKVGLRVIALGGYPSVSIDEIKPLQKTDDILKELLYREQEGVRLYREVLALCGDNEGTRQVLESNIEQEQDHIDELWRYLKNPELNKANFSSGKDTMKPESRKIAEYEHSFARQPGGIAGAPTPDLPERGFDWHDEHGGPKPPDAAPEDEKEQEEAEKYFKPPLNPLKQPKIKLPPPQPSPQTQEAQKALAGVPRFANGPVMAPRAVDFLLEHGFAPEEIMSGEANMTPRMRGLYNRNLLSQVRKSISSIGRRE